MHLKASLVSRLRTVVLIAVAFFCALLGMYRFDFGMTVAVLGIAAVFAAIGFALNWIPGL